MVQERKTERGYSRNALALATMLRAALQRTGFSMFNDDGSVHENGLWHGLHKAVGDCSAFAVPVAWRTSYGGIGIRVQVALNRLLGGLHAQRLPISPILPGSAMQSAAAHRGHDGG